MPANQPNPKVDAVLAGAGTWREEFARLRAIALSCGLTEDLKWGQPCYAHAGANIVLIHGFKAYCALLFFKGAVMPDPEKLLIQQTQNVQAARQMRFASMDEIVAREPLIRAYIANALAAEKAGLKVALKKTADYPVPPEFQARLDKSAALAKAFAALTPGRQRAYFLHFGGAKQAATREARIDKCTPRILAGKGLDD